MSVANLGGSAAARHSLANRIRSLPQVGTVILLPHTDVPTREMVPDFRDSHCRIILLELAIRDKECEEGPGCVEFVIGGRGGPPVVTFGESVWNIDLVERL